MMKTRLKKSIALGATALAGFLLWWFQPWLLVTDSEVTESVPTPSISPTTIPSSGSTPSTEIPDKASTSLQPAVPESVGEPKGLLFGRLISHEHETSGTVRVLSLADGSRVLRLENFDTSNGPDLEVWLSDAPVIVGQAGWFLADDGEHVSLGKLKGNKGNQNYVIPPELDLSRFSSVSIWCVRFSVSFGAAELAK
jgi:hypothetical protein